MSSADQARARLALGKVIINRNVASRVQEGSLNAQDYLDRHAQGDWGDLPPDRHRANDRGVTHHDLVYSRYVLDPSSRLYVITDSERSVTSMWLVTRVPIQP